MSIDGDRLQVANRVEVKLSGVCSIIAPTITGSDGPVTFVICSVQDSFSVKGSHVSPDPWLKGCLLSLRYYFMPRFFVIRLICYRRNYLSLIFYAWQSAGVVVRSDPCVFKK